MAKTVNYTPEMETLMARMYLSVRAESETCRDDMVKLIAEELKKNERSVRAKLSRMEIYKPKMPVSKVTGGEAAKKIELATTVASLVSSVIGKNVNPETLAKAGKTDLVFILEAMVSLSPESNG